jgi:hypothetical protein
MLITLVGLCNLLFGWPLIFLLRLARIESSTLGDLTPYEPYTLEIYKRVLTNLVSASVLAFGKSINLDFLLKSVLFFLNKFFSSSS